MIPVKEANGVFNQSNIQIDRKRRFRGSRGIDYDKQKKEKERPEL